jgi:DNA-directed RNA polymerase beta subunit
MTSLNRNHEEINDAIHNEVLKAFNNRKVVGKAYTLVYDNVRGEKHNDSYNEIADKVDKRGTIERKYKADVKIVSNADGKVIDHKKGVYIGAVPMVTKKGGFVVSGNTYNIPNQLRLKPGAYTTVKGNGDTETFMNVVGGKGMKIVSPQDKDEVGIVVGSKKFNPLDVAKVLGASDKEIDRYFGKTVADDMRKTSDVRATSVKLAQTLGIIGPDISPPQEEVEQHLRDYFSKTRLDPDATAKTLGKPISSVGKDAILLGVNRNIGVKSGAQEQDDKENLMYKKVLTPEKLIMEGVQRDIHKPESKIRSVLSNPFQRPTINDVLVEPTLKKAAKSFITTSAISRMPEEYNPLHTLQGSSDITPMGEGGIKSTTMLTPSVRSLHNSQLGFIDPIKSPEGTNTGVTLSVTHGAYVDKDGNPAIRVMNLKNGKKEVRTVGDLWDKKVAFPDHDSKGVVGIREGSKISTGNIRHADFQLLHPEDMYGPAMNSLGVISSNDPTRNLMASKHVTQALPIKDGDPNPVSLASSDGEDMLSVIGKKHLPVSPVSGVVKKIDHKKGKFHLLDAHGAEHLVDFASNPIQLNTKTFIQHHPAVKEGDKVSKGQHLADSAFTKNGKLSIGKNLRTAWMMYPGARNDAFVVSETAAKKLTSVHSSKFDIDGRSGAILDKKKFASMFPEVAKKIDLSKYDERGIIRSGQQVSKDEPIVLGMRRMDPTEARFQNDKVKKLLYGGMIPDMQVWKGDNTATISHVTTNGSRHRVFARYDAQLKTGDKIAGRSGNKGVVAAILPDHEMPHDEDGKPIELILGGAGVISRQNPAQIIEAQLTEVAKKTGKPYVLPHYTHHSMKDFANNEVAKHNVKVYHKIYDPVRKKTLKQPVFVADYNVMKLFKQGEGTYSGVGVGPVDAFDQPLKGGKNSAATISNMEINSLLASDARDFLREVSTIKSQRNKKWFDAYEAGGTPPPPEPKVAREAFYSLLNQLNVKVHKDNDHIHVLPMTDKDVLSHSSGVVKEPFGLKRGTLTHVKNGFYDTAIFGGHGENFGHIDLGVKVLNPMYKKPVAAIMNMTEKQLDNHIEKHGIDTVYKAIDTHSVNSTISRLRGVVKSTKDVSKVDRSIKAIKALKKLQNIGDKPADVMFISKIPVLPVKMRPVGKLPDGSVIDHDVNYHYAAIIKSSNKLKEAKKIGVPADITNRMHLELQHHIGALHGVNPSPDPKLRNKEVKSVMDIIGGANPKTSFWHQKVLRNRVFSSGRAVIVPHIKSLSMDQVEIPKHVAWNAFAPHVTRKMSQMGIPTHEAKKKIEARDATATNVLHSVMKEVPVVINRSPALHKFNMTGHYAKISGGNTMHIPPEIEVGQNADYDGDQLAIHVPLTQKAIRDVKTKLMASKQLFQNAKKGEVMMGIDLDPFIGFYDATKKKGKTA